MPILIETIDPETTPIQQKSLNETGWTGFNSPRSSNVGQTRGPAGMGMNAYVDRPETQPNWVPFKPSDLGYESNVGSSMQTHGPAGMGMRAYMNRPMDGIFAGSRASNANNMVNAMMGGMNRSQQDGYDVAEISEQQGNWMGSPYGNPEHWLSSPQGFEDYKRGVQGQAENWGHGFLGLGGQEDATDQEIKDRLLQNIKNKQWEGDTPSLEKFKDWGLV